MKKHTEKKWTKKLKKVKIVEKNEEREFYEKNNNYGITLIALVITVIVLLILASISISMLSGDNAILSRAGQTKTKTEYGKAQEIVALAQAEAVSSKYLNNTDLYATIVSILHNSDSGLTLVQGKSGEMISKDNVKLSMNGEEITSINIKAGETKIIDLITGNFSEAIVPYYVKVDGKYYELLNNGEMVTLSTTETPASIVEDGKTYKIEIRLDDSEKGIIASYDENTKKIALTGSSEATEATKVNLIIDYVSTENSEESGWVDGNKEYNVALFVPLTQQQMNAAKGQFVKYNVPYTDAYNTTYSYNDVTGWRILKIEAETTTNAVTGAEEEKGKYNVEIISTGIPVRVRYASGTQNTRWWGTTKQVISATTETDGYDGYYKGIGSSGFKSHTSWNRNYSAYYAAYGLKFNFTKIKFNKGIPSSWSSSNNNIGYYDTLNGETDNLNTEEKVLRAFKEKQENSNLANKVTGIRSVEAKDIRSTYGKVLSNSISSISSTEDKGTGLFILNNIKNNTLHGLGDYTYSSIGSYYWVANPCAVSNLEDRLHDVTNSGTFSKYQDAGGAVVTTGADINCGIRPVITLSGVNASYNSTTDLWTLE